MPTEGTKRQSVRCPQDLWDAFGEAVARNEPPKDRSEVLRGFMRWYIRSGNRLPDRPPRDDSPGHDSPSG